MHNIFVYNNLSLNVRIQVLVPLLKYCFQKIHNDKKRSIVTNEKHISINKTNDKIIHRSDGLSRYSKKSSV